MTLRFTNSLTQTKEPFVPRHEGRIGMYVCGPTVYSESHIGHMVGPVIFDTLKRFLEFRGFEVTWVVNITDVDDKLIAQAAKEGSSVAEVAARVTDDYLACLHALGVDGIDHMPRATEYIPAMITMIQGLIDSGHAYASQGDVYFDVNAAPDYGKLSHRKRDDLMAGARIEVGERKKHPGDFALWKGSKPGEPAWASPWGPGRPGWHIECSAMCRELLGEEFDIHGGGNDLIFPHHENELAQSEAATGKSFAKYWLHNGLLTKDGRKISKSDPETVILMRDLLQKHDPDTIRALLLSSHYRRPIDYSNDRLDEIARSLKAFHNYFKRFKRIAGLSFFELETADHDLSEPGRSGLSKFLDQISAHRAGFLDALEDDFNTGGALGEFFELLRLLNRQIDTNDLESTPQAEGVEELITATRVLRELSSLFGLFRDPPEEKAGGEGDAGLTAPLVELLIEVRAALRKKKEFALADQIRDRLKQTGIVLEDRPDSTLWSIEG